MSVELWRQKSDRLCTQLGQCALFSNAKTVLAYFSFRQEPDLSPLFHDCRHRWGFPRCVGNSLSWHLWKPQDSLNVGAYGSVEPQPHAPIIRPDEVDLILVPSVACDHGGYRLGYGGGYYDRLLSLPTWLSKPTIGIVFDDAYLPTLPLDSWDKPLDLIATDVKIINHQGNNNYNHCPGGC